MPTTRLQAARARAGTSHPWQSKTTRTSANDYWGALPLELKEMIIRSCDQPTLHALRATNKYHELICRRVFLPVFEHIAIHLSPWSIERLRVLSQSSKCASMVRTLTIYTSRGWGQRYYSRKPEPSAQMISEMQEFREHSSLLNVLTTAFMPLKNLRGVAFEDCTIFKHVEDLHYLPHLSHGLQAEGAEFLDKVLDPTRIFGLGVRDFIHTCASDSSLMRTFSSGLYAIHSPIENVAENYFDVKYPFPTSTVLQAFTGAGLHISSYREYGHHHDGRRHRNAGSGYNLQQMGYQPELRQLQALQSRACDTWDFDGNKIIRHLHLLPQLKTLRFKIGSIRYERDDDVELDAAKMLSRLWSSSGMPQLETLVVSWSQLFSTYGLSDESVESRISQFLRQRSSTLRRVVLGCETRPNVNILVSCVKDELQLEHFAIHWDNDPKPGNHGFRSSINALNDELVDGRLDQSDNALWYVRHYDTRSIVVDGDVQSQLSNMHNY